MFDVYPLLSQAALIDLSKSTIVYTLAGILPPEIGWRIVHQCEMLLDRWWQKNNAARRRQERNIHETISNEH